MEARKNIKKINNIHCHVPRQRHVKDYA